MKDQAEQSDGITGSDGKQAVRSEERELRQHTLPDTQSAKAACVQNEIPQIIDKMVSIAREIGWLSERKAPVESGSEEPASGAASR